MVKKKLRKGIVVIKVGIKKKKKPKKRGKVKKFDSIRTGKILMTRKEKTLRKIIDSRGASPASKARARQLLGI